MEVSVHRKSYSTQLVDLEDQTGGKENVVRTHDGGFLKSNVFTLTIPQVLYSLCILNYVATTPRIKGMFGVQHTTMIIIDV